MTKIPVLISDVHGCLDELDELLKTIQYSSRLMRLVFLGDLVHRGLDSLGVVRRVKELNVECIKGNHEDSLLRWRKHQKVFYDTGKLNPMKTPSLVDKIANESLSEDDLIYLKNLPIKLDLGLNWWAVHAGMEPGLPFEKQVPPQMMRVRYVNEMGRGVSLNPDKSQPEGTVYWDQMWKGPQSILYGHCVHNLKEIRYTTYNEVSMIGIDTGCVFGGHLTASFMHKGTSTLEGITPLYETYKPEFVQIKAKQKYCEGYGDE